MLTLTSDQAKYLFENGFSISEFQLENGTAWIYSETHVVVSKGGCYELYKQEPGRMVLLATICTELDMESFIQILDGFGVVKLEVLF